MMPNILDTTRHRWTVSGWTMLTVSCLVLTAPLPANAHGDLQTAHDTAICRTISDSIKASSPMAQAHAPLRLAQAAPPPAVDEKALAAELAAMLQACSFDGKLHTERLY